MFGCIKKPCSFQYLGNLLRQGLTFNRIFDMHLVKVHILMTKKEECTETKSWKVNKRLSDLEHANILLNDNNDVLFMMFAYLHLF